MDSFHLAWERAKCGLTWTQWWTLRFHKMWGTSWLAKKLAATQEKLSSNASYECHKLLSHALCHKGESEDGEFVSQPVTL